MRSWQRDSNPLHETLRYDAQGHYYYETPYPTNLQSRKQLLEQTKAAYDKQRKDVMKPRPRTHQQDGARRHRNVAASQPELSILEERQNRLSRYIEGYKVEHVFPHIYSGWGVPSTMPVTAFGPRKGRPAYRTTSQEHYAWEPPDIDVYAERKNFTRKGDFTEYLRASIKKQVNLKRISH